MIVGYAMLFFGTIGLIRFAIVLRRASKEGRLKS